MKRLPTLLLAAALTTLSAPLVQAQGPADPIGRNLFPPDLIMSNADAIKLTDSQKQAVQEAMQENQPHFTELQEGLRQEMETFGKMLGDPAAAAPSVLAEFDKVQDREREIKRAQLALLLGLRATLNDEQRAKLAELRAKNPPPQGRPEFAAKMQRIRAGAEKWQSEGRDPSQIREIMERFGPLMRDGKAEEANAVLDEALKALEAGGK
jgi:Spy/CpxP family protein refolding chaperone